MGWRDVLAQYSNRYEESVNVTAIDDKGQRQTITSNRIHPFFARVAAGAILATASVVTTQVAASEGHVYTGDIAGGAWVDAQHLKPGDELLSAANQWLSVESVVVEQEPLEAYNLTVDDYSTYFVAGDVKADAVWVHNTCYIGRPDGFRDIGKDPDTGQNRIDDGHGRILYQGHPPNEDKWYDLSVPGRVQSRINLANGRTDTTPLRDSGEPVSAGFDHMLQGHFNVPLANNRSVFTITPDELKTILQSKPVVDSPVTSLGDGHFVRTVDVGNSRLNIGGGLTSKIKIFTDRAGNIISAYPI